VTRQGKWLLTPAAAVAAGLALLTAGRAFALEQRGGSAYYPLAPCSQVVVENVQGSIRVEGWDRAEVEVVVVKTFATAGAEPEDVVVSVEQREGELRLRTVYAVPLEEPARVDYRLRVPRQIKLKGLRTLEGNITVRDIEGSVEALVLRGNITQVNISGAVTARTINGDVLVSLRALPEAATGLSLEAANGNLFLLLPPGANADLEMSTTAGRIEGSLPTTVSATPGDAALRARLGRGGTRVRLRTIRGNIRVVEGEELL
jgi:hypothetical protein